MTHSALAHWTEDPAGTFQHESATVSGFAPNPLRVNPNNPRYFTDDSGQAILLTGSHTWSVMADNGGSNPPPAFDYTAWLDFLETNGHNFFRLWAWEQTRWTLETTDNNYWFFPMPYVRTGPGNAIDGQPKFDLNQLNQAYFDRLRARVMEANERGIYVAIVLFNGWSNVSNKGGFSENNPWQGHPFNPANNINGMDGDPNNNNSGEEVHELGNSAITALQEAYVQKVIDTVNDLYNVLYEISNESHAGSVNWQYHLIDVIKTYEAGKPVQHPVGMSAPWPGVFNNVLFNSDADWISINDTDGDFWNPRPADGEKVLITDTDHLCGVCGNRDWAWRTFLRGHNPIFMDVYDGAGYGVGADGFDPNDPTFVSVRENMGYILSYAQRVNLVDMAPHGELASSGYALANPTASGAEYLVYFSNNNAVTVNLSAASGSLTVEWFNVVDGTTTPGGTTTGGGNRTLNAPFFGDWVVYVFGNGTVTTTPSTPTATSTPSSTSLVTNTPTPTTTATPSFTPTKTPTLTISPTATATSRRSTPVATFTPTPSPTGAPSNTPTLTTTATNTQTPTATSLTPTQTPTPTPTLVTFPSATPRATRTPLALSESSSSSQLPKHPAILPGKNSPSLPTYSFR